MEDIPLFGNESTKVHEAKEKKLYYTDEEIVSRERVTRKSLYVLSALVVVCAGVFGYLAYNSYVNDIAMSQQLSNLSFSMESSFSILTERIDALGRRIVGLEEKTEQLEQKTAENKEAIQKTQEEVTEVKDTQENLRITAADAEQIALNWVAGTIQGISVPRGQWDFKDGKFYVYEFDVDNTSVAKKVDQQIISVTETEEGFLVEMILAFKGFTFTNDKLYWQVGILVDSKGIATQKYLRFAH
jgi:hypothetical protein